MDSPLSYRLSADPWVSSLEPTARSVIISEARPRLYPSGSLVYAQDEDAEGFYGIIGGELRFTRTSSDGRRTTLVQVGAGTWVGELAFLDWAPRMHDAHAVGDTLLAVIPAPKMRQLVSQHPGLRDGLVKLLASHTRRLYAAVDELLFMTPERLLAIRLCERLGEGGSSTISMSQEDIAGLIGISRQSANRILKKLETAGIIKRQYRGFEIVDKDALEARAAKSC